MVGALSFPRLRQRDELLDRDLFSTRSRIEPGRRDQRRRIGAERAQALAQHLSSLTESGLRYRFERRSIA